MKTICMLFTCFLSSISLAHEFHPLVVGTYQVAGSGFVDLITVKDRGGHEYGIELCVDYTGDIGCKRVDSLIVRYNEENQRYETVTKGSIVFRYRGVQNTCTTKKIAMTFTTNDLGDLFIRMNLPAAPSFNKSSGCRYYDYQWRTQSSPLVLGIVKQPI